MDEQSKNEEETMIDALARILILIAKAVAANDKNDNAKHKQPAQE